MLREKEKKRRTDAAHARLRATPGVAHGRKEGRKRKKKRGYDPISHCFKKIRGGKKKERRPRIIFSDEQSETRDEGRKDGKSRSNYRNFLTGGGKKKKKESDLVVLLRDGRIEGGRG